MKKLSLLLLICFIAFPAKALKYTVTVPSGTNACFIAGDFNNWTFSEMTKSSATEYYYENPAANTSQGYKYCSGPEWAYVEKDSKGVEISDRVYSSNDVVETWASLWNNLSGEPLHVTFLESAYQNKGSFDPGTSGTIVGDLVFFNATSGNMVEFAGSNQEPANKSELPFQMAGRTYLRNTGTGFRTVSSYLSGTTVEVYVAPSGGAARNIKFTVNGDSVKAVTTGAVSNYAEKITYTTKATGQIGITANGGGGLYVYDFKIIPVEPQIPSEEYQALVDLYNATAGTGWKNKWNNISQNNVHEGNWYGVKVSLGHVTEINLSDNYLRGTIPASIQNLPYLQKLILSGNQLTSSMPASLNNLTSLLQLELRNNQLSGTIPDLRGLTKLQSLYLNQNQLKNMIAALPTVTPVYWWDSGFNLTNQSITIDTLRFKGNDVSIDLPQICTYNHSNKNFNAANRFRLYIDNSQRGDFHTASEYGTLTIPASVLLDLRTSQNVYLQQYEGDASGTKITFQNIKIELPRVPDNEYEALVAIYNALHGETWYNKWDISQNNLHKGAWYGVSLENGHITKLNLQDNGLYGNLPPEIGNLTYLKELNLSHNGYGTYYTSYYITGEIPGSLGNLVSMEYLSLNNNQLSGNIPAELSNLPGVITVDLSYNQLSGNIPVTITNLLTLKYLYLGHNKLTGTILPEFNKLTELIGFSLDNNLLSGIVPSLSNLTKLDGLYLSNNQLEDIEAILPNAPFGWSFSLGNQSISLDTLHYNGNDIIISLPRICLYDYYSKNFNAVNSFEVRVNNSKVGSNISANEEGKITIPSSFLANLGKGQPVSVCQINGTASGTILAYDTVKIATSNIPDIEYQALVALYNSAHGETWYNKWDVSQNNLHEGVWYGITIEDGHVTKLNLESNGLYGSLPEEIGNLTYLRELNLSNNSYYYGWYDTRYPEGNIPASLGNLSNLESLNLSGNRFSGNIPAELGNLANLQDLYLNNNLFTGSIPDALGSLTALQNLNLGYNQLAGVIPASLNNLTVLKQLELYNNQLSGTVPALNNLTQLSSLNISNNHLSDLEVPLPNTSYYWGFNIGYQSLSIDTLHYTGSDVVVSLPRITLYNHDAKNFNATNRFEVLINGSKIEDFVATDVQGHLTIPASYFSSLRKGQPVSLRQIEGTSYYTTLLYDTVEINIPHIPDVEYNALVALYNSTHGELWFNKWDVSENNLHEGAWYGITIENSHVTKINLPSNGLHGTLPEEIGNLAYLRELNLSSNNYSYGWYDTHYLEGAIPASIGNLSNLKSLSLNDNHFTGNIPAELGNLVNLKDLNLYNNQLNGNIPDALGNLTSLQNLNVRNNLLSGSIPASFNSLVILNQLELSNNQLSGTIPALNNLTQLSSLNFTNNNLEDVEAPLPDVSYYWSFNIGYQSISLDTLHYEGNDIVIPLPQITLYNHSAKNFQATNKFEVRINNNVTGDNITPDTQGNLTIPHSYLSGLKKGQSVSFRQVEGTASYTVLYYDTITINLPRIPEEEYEALIALYNSTHGETWHNKWDISENNLHEGAWYGVSMENGHITKLNLPDNRLYGNLPSELSNLSYLQELNLSNNSSYQYEPSYGYMYKYFEGNIPASLGNLSQLKVLDLSYCHFSGSIPDELGQLTNLQKLNLSNNQLTGSIPKELGGMKSIEYLYLNNNQLSGLIPSTIASFGKLKELNLSYNKLDILENTLPYSQSVPVYLSYQSINRDIILVNGDDVIVDLPNICTYDHEGLNFNLRNNFTLRINGNAKVTVQAGANGQVIFPASYFLNIQPTDKISIYQENGKSNYSTINYDSYCTALDIIPDSEFQVLVALYNATAGADWKNKWDVSANTLNEKIWYGVTVESGHITKIKLQGNNLNGFIPAELGGLPFLKELLLNDNLLSDAIPVELGNLESLTKLSLYNNQLSGNIPESVGNLRVLTEMYLQKNALTGKIPVTLANITTLKELQLNNNQLNDTIPTALGAMNSLVSLNISNNQIKGKLPQTINNLDNLRMLDISNNSISELENIITFGSNVSVNLNNQQIDNTEPLLIDGNMITLQLPNICTYNHTAKNFNARNEFIIKLNGETKGSVTALESGNLLFAASLVENMTDGDEISIVQKNGQAYGTSLIFHAVRTITTPIPDSEFQALTAIYNSLGGASWINKWNITQNDLHIRDWYGVSINQGHVISIQLPSNNVTGNIPDLSGLPYLQTLDLSHNSISGVSAILPASITTLRLNNQRFIKGEFVLNGTSSINIPVISTYNHEGQNFGTIPMFDIYAATVKMTPTPLPSVAAGLLFSTINEDVKIPLGTPIELRQTNGSATGTSLYYIITYKMGDANVDGLVNIQDVQQTLNCILLEKPRPFNFVAADINADSKVNVQDIVLTVNLIQSMPLQSPLMILRSSSENVADLKVENGIVYLESPVEISGLDIRMAGTSSSGIQSLIADENIQFIVGESENQTSVIVFSVSGSVIPAGKTALFTIAPGQVIENALLINKSAQPVEHRISNAPNQINNAVQKEMYLLNAPNPFVETTEFIYQLNEEVSSVQIRIYDQTGRLVDMLQNLPVIQGENRVVYINQSLAAGLYYYELEAVQNGKLYLKKSSKMLIRK